MQSEQTFDQIAELIAAIIKTNDFNNKESPEKDPIQMRVQQTMLVPKAQDLPMLLNLKQKTQARIGIWRAGTRLLTDTSLKLRLDHAFARDSVFNLVDEEFIKKMGLFIVQTKCGSKNEFLTRPDLGALFDEETTKLLATKCKVGSTVQIYVADGLSSSAVEANLADILPALEQGLQINGLKTGTPFFVKYGRVPSMDAVSQIVQAEITCVLIGERPGLATAESMSAYIAYKAEPNMSESRRTVVSNIHKGGIPAVEAGAYIADVIMKIHEAKKSGVELKL